MKKPLLCLIFIAFAINVYNQNLTDNFSFEKTISFNGLPENWFQWGSKNFTLKIDTVEKYHGKNAILIEPNSEIGKNDFGCIAIRIPAKYDAKKAELSAYMKLENVTDGFVGLLLRIDGVSGPLAFDNMQKNNIKGTSEWQKYSITLAYPKEAKTIYVGALLSGKGKLWVDNFQLKLDDKDISEVQQKTEFKATTDTEFDNGSKITSIPLTNSKINDLEVLGKVWGFLKYYHPAIAKGNYNWDYELFRILPKIINTNDQTERNNIISDRIKKLDKTEYEKPITNQKKEIKIKPDLSFIDSKILGQNLANQLTELINANRTGTNFYVSLIENIGNPDFTNENQYAKMKYPDAGLRLLSLYRYWNIIQYYFPYKNLIKEDWNQVLKEFIPKFVNASNELEYKLATLQLIARIHDTHANIWMRDSVLNLYKGVNYPSFEVRFIENKAVVTNFYIENSKEAEQIKIGDIIEEINDVKVENIVKAKLPYTPASNYLTQLRDLAGYLLRSNDTILNIKYKRNHDLKTITIKLYQFDKLNFYSRYNKKDTCFKILTSDISYLNPGFLKTEYLETIMPLILKTKALIIDFRSYPADYLIYSLGAYLMPDSVEFVKFSNGSVRNPGEFTMTEALKIGTKNKDYYKGKVIILVNETTQSSAEYHTMGFRKAPNAKVIGSSTAGADGNVSKIYLPGGIYTMISGIGVYYPDGRETQRIGIVPDIEVIPSIEGIRNHKDEVLEKAIEIINKR